MSEVNNRDSKTKIKKVYKKPVFVKCEKMTFPLEIISKFNGSRFCVQCSGCHGCR